MKSKYRFIEQFGYEACLEKAKALLGVEEQEIYIELFNDGANGEPCKMLVAVKRELEPSEASDGEIVLHYEEDGVYLEKVPARGNGHEADLGSFRAYLARKNIKDLDSQRLQRALTEQGCYIRIAPSQQEVVLNEQTQVRLSHDEMEAYLMILPPDPNGRELTLEQALAEIREDGVVYGIDESIVQDLLDSKSYFIELGFAKGKPPENGTDGEIIFHFSVEHSGTPVILEEDGKVDYKNLSLFTPVKAGDKLVSRTLATDGEPGYTVTGRRLEPKRGKEARLPKGKNVEYDEERLNMFAKINGKVDYIGDTVSVLDCYTVKGDANLSVGNLDFDGDIIITGNVISELRIKASRNIEVYGVVEAAELIAGGNIVLRKGIQGNDKGVLTAGGDIIAKYMERTRMKAGGSITVDSMIHCQAVSGGSICAKGRHGSIIGGSLRAQNSITAQNIGSVVHTKTSVEVGIAPEKRERMEFLESEIGRLKVELEKFEKIAKYLSQSENMPPEKEKLKKTVVLGRIQDMQLIREYNEELVKLKEELKINMGKVHVLGTAYPGVRISIMFCDYNVTSPIKFATFKCENREIVFRPCEA